MGKRQVVGSMSEWSGVLRDFFRQIEDGSLSLQETQLFLEHKNPFLTAVNPFADLIADWQKFYLDVFGLETDFSNLRIPEKREGLDRLLIVAQGMTPQRLYDKCRELFPPCWKWTEKSLDEVIDFSFQTRFAKDGPYAVWVRDRIEADEELKNLSADDLKQKGIPGITLEERLLYELKFFKETGKHLDINSVTLCSGSRYSDGHVPNVFWFDDKMHVNSYHPDHADDDLRARQAVS